MDFRLADWSLSFIILFYFFVGVCLCCCAGSDIVYMMMGTHAHRQGRASISSSWGRTPTQPGPDSLVCKSREKICIFHQTIKSATGGMRETCVSSSSSFSSLLASFCLASSAPAACIFLLFRLASFTSFCAHWTIQQKPVQHQPRLSLSLFCLSVFVLFALR